MLRLSSATGPGPPTMASCGRRCLTFFVYKIVEFFWLSKNILTGKPTHSALKVSQAPCSYRLRSKVSITLHCQLCLTRVRMNCSKALLLLKVATMKNMSDLHYTKEAITCATTKLRFFTVRKDE